MNPSCTQPFSSDSRHGHRGVRIRRSCSISPCIFALSPSPYAIAQQVRRCVFINRFASSPIAIAFGLHRHSSKLALVSVNRAPNSWVKDRAPIGHLVQTNSVVPRHQSCCPVSLHSPRPSTSAYQSRYWPRQDLMPCFFVCNPGESIHMLPFSAGISPIPFLLNCMRRFFSLPSRAHAMPAATG